MVVLFYPLLKIVDKPMQFDQDPDPKEETNTPGGEETTPSTTPETPEAPTAEPTNMGGDTSPSLKTGGTKQKKTMTPTRWVITVGALVVGFIAFVAVSQYQFGWRQPFLVKAASALHLPAAKINGQTISYTEWVEVLDAMEHFYGTETGQEIVQNNLLPDQNLGQMVLDRLERKVVIDGLAQEYGISVSEEDINETFDNQIVGEGNREEILQSLQDLYQWDEAQFKKYVVEELLLNEQIYEAILEDPKYTQEAETLAQSVLEKARSGEQTFADLAKDYSEDITAEQGGELGEFGKDEMVSEFSDAAFALEEDGISDLVQTQFGFHIIQVTDKNEAEEKVTASHILIRVPTLDEVIYAKLQEANVTTYVKL